MEKNNTKIISSPNFWNNKNRSDLQLAGNLKKYPNWVADPFDLFY